MSRFEPERIMQIIGVLAPIVFVLAVGLWREQVSERKNESNSILLIGLIVFFLTLQGSVALREKLLSNLSLGSIWITAIVAVVVISLSFTLKYWRIGLVLLIGASLFSVANVNPIVRGIGIFGQSSAMTVIDAAGKLSQGRWASDNFSFDSVTTGAGMRLLSGNQGSGPNYDAYHLLDPNEEHIEIWNRGGSYVFFNWTTGPQINFINPGMDLVAIQIDPCNQILTKFDLGWVVSSTDLSSHTCLRYYQNIIFQGVRFNVYKKM